MESDVWLLTCWSERTDYWTEAVCCRVL